MRYFKQFILALIFIALLFSTDNVSAQSYYFNVSTGYAMNMQPGDASDIYMNSNTTYTALKIPGSFGKGWNIGVAGGYYVLPFLAVELGINELYGSTYTTSQTLKINDNHALTLDQATYGKMFKICPMVKFSTFDKKIPPYNNNTAKDGGRWVEYYAKAGLSIGLSNKLVSDQVITKYDTTTSLAYNTTTEYRGGTSTGLNLKFGASFKQNERIHLFVELSFLVQYFSPSYCEKTLYYVGEADLLNSLPTSNRKTNYVPMRTPSSGNENEPSQALQISYPFSSVGLNVGIEFKWNR